MPARAPQAAAGAAVSPRRPAPPPPPGWRPPHERDLCPGPQHPAVPLEVGCWVVADLAPPPAWPDLRLARVTGGPRYTRDRTRFVSAELWRVDAAPAPVNRPWLLRVDLGELAARAAALAAERTRLVLEPGATLWEAAPLLRVGALAARYVAEVSPGGEASALAEHVRRLEVAVAAAEDFRRRGLPSLLAGLRDAAMCAAVADATEAALAAALGEVRRQGGPDFLLTEAHGAGLAAARWRLLCRAYAAGWATRSSSEPSEFPPQPRRG